MYCNENDLNDGCTLAIPLTHKQYRLTTIDRSAFAGVYRIARVEAPHIKAIKYQAFKGCRNIVTVHAEDLYDLGDQAFEGCTSLENFYNNLLHNIGNRAFKGCYSLDNFWIDSQFINFINSVGSSAFEGCTSLSTLGSCTIGTIYSFAFKGCTSLVNFNFNQTKWIGDNAFSGCKKLEKVVFTNELKKIGSNVFNGCSKLTKFDLTNCPNDLTLDSNAFSGVSPIANYYVHPENNRLIDKLINDQQISPEHIIFSGKKFDVSKNDSIVYIHESAIKDDNTLTIPKDYIGIGSNSLGVNQSARNLVSVNFENGSQIKKIDPNAFEGWVSPTTKFYVNEDDQQTVNALKSSFSSDQIVIKGTRFNVSGDGTITSVKTNDSVVTIPTSYSGITLKKIAQDAFADCNSVRKVVFSENNSINEFASGAFNGLGSNVYYYVDENSNLVKKLNSAGINDRNIVFSKDDFDITKSGLIHRVKANRSVTDVTIPTDRAHDKSITGIDDYAFAESPQINKITFKGDNSSFSISSKAFADLDSNQTYYYADKSQSSLITNLKSTASIQSNHIISVDGEKFALTEDNHIHQVKLAANDNGSVTIPKSYQGTDIAGINSHAFSKCKDITKIVFEDGVSSLQIASDALDDLVPSKTYYYVGEQHQQLITNLNENRIDSDHIVISTPKFDITKSGLILSVRESSETKSVNIKSKIGADEIPVTGFGPNAFSKSPQIEQINFDGEINSLKFDQQTFSDLKPDSTYYYVKQDKNSLINQLKTINIDQDHIVFGGTKFDLTAKGTIHRVHQRAISGGKIIIPAKIDGKNDVSGIDQNVFSECKGQNLTAITFETNSLLTNVSPQAFSGLDPTKTLYYVNESAKNIIRSLKDKTGSNDNIVVQGANFNISVAGTLLKISSAKPHLLIEKTYAEINVTGLGSKVFQNKNIKIIEFANGIKLNGQIASDAFDGLNLSVIHVYDSVNASALAEAINGVEIGVNNDGGNFFTNYKNANELNGLTSRGREQEQLMLNDSINRISSNAFVGCSSSLNKITIKSASLTIDDHAFEVDSLKNIKSNIEFWVSDSEVKAALVAKGIEPNKIQLLSLPTTKKNPSKTNGFSSKNIGIIVGSICFAILLLGLGIGIPMHKQHKISMLQAKLNGRRIDKLSAANAMAFKKVVEATGNISKQVNKLAGKVTLLDAPANKSTRKPYTLISKVVNQPIKSTTSPKPNVSQAITKGVANQNQTIFKAPINSTKAFNKSVIFKKTVLPESLIKSPKERSKT